MNLHDALRAYSMMVVEKFGAGAEATPGFAIRGLDEWRREPDGSFLLHDLYEEGWKVCLMQHLETLHASPEFVEVTAALTADAAIAPQLGVLVGSGVGVASQVTVERIVDGFVWRLASLANGLRHDDAIFNRVFTAVSTELRAPDTEVVALAPLLGFRAEQLPVRLTESLAINAMTDDQIAMALKTGGIRPFFGQHRRTTPIAPLAAIVVSRRLPKKLGELGGPHDAVAFWNDSSERVGDVVHALRLFKGERFQAPVIIFLSGWPNDGGCVSQPLGVSTAPVIAPTYNLSTEEAERFATFWSRLQRPATHNWVGMATRRFSYAIERQRPDDMITDFLIAAESLFLSDTGKSKDRGEMRFRLALRAAVFIEDSGASRRALLDFFKRAYNVRSAIVHGGVPDAADLKSLTGEKVSLIELATLTERLMRLALKGAIETEKPDDWDALVVS